MAEVQCPIGDCEYTDSLGSVEAHISGSTAGEHSGEEGRDHRSTLRESIESESEPSNEGGNEEPVEEEGEGDVDPSLGPEGAVPAVAATGLFASGSGEGGIPVGKVVLAGVVVVVSYYAYKQVSGGSDGGTDEQVDQQESESRVFRPGGGIHG